MQSTRRPKDQHHQASPVMVLEPVSSFLEMDLSAATLAAIELKGYTSPTPVQQHTIPLLLSGRTNVIAQAQTGTGKTAAFAIPLIERLQSSNGRVRAIVLTPTRELTVQVHDELVSLVNRRGLSVLPVYGGVPIGQQIRSLREGVDIVVGTPGRVIDHIERKTLDLSSVEYFVLDEADEMLDMGFLEDVEFILESAGAERNVWMFSATMPPEIIRLARNTMGNYETIRTEAQQLTTELVEQVYYEVRERDKFSAMCRLLDVNPDFYGLIFCETKVETDHVAAKLLSMGYPAEALHGDVPQAQREKILARFKRQRIQILVATDVAARGIDVTGLTHVVNFSFPRDAESYVHRIGRTGRAGRQGVAISLVSPEEASKLRNTRRTSKADIKHGVLPAVEEVIAAKKVRLLNALTKIQEREQTGTEYRALAEELLVGRDSTEAVAGLLQLLLRDELDPGSYPEIQAPERPVTSNQSNGWAKLYIGLGRHDGYHPKSMIDYICREARLSPRQVQNLRVLTNFSLFSVPADLEDKVLDIFASKKRGKYPLVKRDQKREG